MQRRVKRAVPKSETKNPIRGEVRPGEIPRKSPDHPNQKLEYFQTRSEISAKKENPRLHELYVLWAMEHLTVLRKTMKKLSSFSNSNMIEPYVAVQQQIEKLVLENPAYTEAAARLFAGQSVEKIDSKEGSTLKVHGESWMHLVKRDEKC